MPIEYDFDGSAVKLRLKSPDETMYELTVQDGGDLESGGTPVSNAVVVAKSSDESITSSTTMQNDDDLFFDLLAAETWTFEFYLIATETGTNPNIKILLAASSGLTGSIEYSYGKIGEDAKVLSDFTTESSTINLTAVKVPISIRGCVTAINAGRLNLQWAQAASDVDATIVHAQSFLKASKAT